MIPITPFCKDPQLLRGFQIFMRSVSRETFRAPSFSQLVVEAECVVRSFGCKNETIGGVSPALCDLVIVLKGMNYVTPKGYQEEIPLSMASEIIYYTHVFQTQQGLTNLNDLKSLCRLVCIVATALLRVRHGAPSICN